MPSPRSGKIVKATTITTPLTSSSIKAIQKSMVSKISTKWPPHPKEVLVKNVDYRITSASIVKNNFSAYVTLISVRTALQPKRVIKTYFSALQTSKFILAYSDVVNTPNVLCDLVFRYTGEKQSEAGNQYSGFKFEKVSCSDDEDSMDSDDV